MKQIINLYDKVTKKNIINDISDIPGGVSIDLSTLVAGNIVAEATPLSSPSNGKRKICKQAKLLAGSSTTVFRVETATHNFKTGDLIMQQAGGGARTGTVVIAAGTSGGITYDTITVGTALESGAEGTWIYQSSISAGAGATNGALENVANSILKESFVVPSDSYVIFIADAYLRADVVEDCIGDLYLNTLDVKEVKY